MYLYLNTFKFYDVLSRSLCRPLYITESRVGFYKGFLQLLHQVKISCATGNLFVQIIDSDKIDGNSVSMSVHLYIYMH